MILEGSLVIANDSQLELDSAETAIDVGADQAIGVVVVVVLAFGSGVVVVLAVHWRLRGTESQESLRLPMDSGRDSHSSLLSQYLNDSESLESLNPESIAL